MTCRAGRTTVDRSVPSTTGAIVTGFAQLIEWKTSRYDEVEKLNEDNLDILNVEDRS